MIPGLTEALQRRRRFVDETSETAEGEGLGGGGRVAAATGAKGSKFAGETFVDRSPTGFTGLINLGATCYLNSLLQMLYMTPEFRKALYEWEYDEERDGEESLSIGAQLRRLFAQMQMTRRGALSTRQLTRAFGWEGAEAFQQHDVLECMTVMLSELERVGAGGSLEEWVRSGHRGNVRSFRQCTQCGHIGESTEAFLAPPLPIKYRQSLEECLDSYVTPEPIEDFRCSECGNLVTILKGQHFQKEDLPTVLSLQLNRFDFSFETMSRVKLNDAIAIPEFINMAPYCKRRLPDDGPQEEGVEGEEEGGEEEVWYELYAVMMHTGSAHGGHYFAYIKNLAGEKREEDEEEGGEGDGDGGGGDGGGEGKRVVEWVKFNDASVAPLDGERVKWALGSEDWKAGEKKKEEEEKKKGEEAGVVGGEGGSDASTSKPPLPPSPSSPSSPDTPVATEMVQEAAKAGNHGDRMVVRSSSNAYMLAYHRHASGPRAPGDRGEFAPPLLDASSLPTPLREALEADNERYKELKKEWDYLKELVRCKVYLPQEDADQAAADAGNPLAGVGADGHKKASSSAQFASVTIHNSRTVDHLTVAAARACGIVAGPRDVEIEGEAPMPEEKVPGQEEEGGKGGGGGGDEEGDSGEKEEEEPDSTSPASSPPSSLTLTPKECLERCRLRHFDSLRGVMLAPIEFPPRGTPAVVEEKKETDEKGGEGKGEGDGEGDGSADASTASAPLLRELVPGIEPHRPLVLEVRRDGEEWVEWQEGGLPLKVLRRSKDSAHGETESAKQFSVIGDSLTALRLAVARRLGEDVSRVRLVVLHEETPVALGEDVHPVAGGPGEEDLKWSFIGIKPPKGTPDRPVLWDESQVRLGRDLKLVAGDAIFAETVDARYLPNAEDPELASIDALLARRAAPSPVKEMLEGMVNQVEITFSNIASSLAVPEEEEEEKEDGKEGAKETPSDTTQSPPSSSAPSSAPVVESVMVDQRQSLGALREVIASVMGVPTDSFKILRTERGPEMKDGEKSLTYYGFMGGGRVWLRPGRPLSLGEVALKISLFDAEAAAKEDDEAEKKAAARRGAGRGRGGASSAGSARPRPRPRPRPMRGGARPRPGRGGGGRGGGVKSGGRVMGAATGRFQFLGTVEVSEDTPVYELKRIIAEQFESIPGVPKASRIRLRERTGAKLAKVLVDAKTLREAVAKRLNDGRELVVQETVEDESFEEGDLLLAIRRWHPDLGVLGPPVEARFPAEASVRHLQAWVVDKVETGLRAMAIPPKVKEGEGEKEAGESSTDGASPSSLTSSSSDAALSVDDVLVGKAHGWQLQVREEMASMRAWSKPVEGGCLLTKDPLRLQSGDVVVWKDRKVEEKYKVEESTEDGRPAKPWKTAARSEAAFHIYTPEERRRRAEEKRKRGEAELAEQAAAKEALKAAGDESGGEEGLLVVDGTNMQPYLKLIAMGVEEERVVAGMLADGVEDPERKLRSGLDRQAALVASKEAEDGTGETE